MQQRMDVSRRCFLSRIGMVAVTYASSSFGALAMHDKNMRGMKKIAPNWASPGFNPDVDIELTCQPGEARILDGRTTGVWRYVANLIKGPENILTTLPDSYLAVSCASGKTRKYASACATDCPNRLSLIGMVCMF